MSRLGSPFSSLRKPRRNGSFARAKKTHINRALPAAQDRAEGNYQQLLKIVTAGIAGSRIIHITPASNKLIQGMLPERVSYAVG